MSENRITLTFPSDARWLPLLEDATRGYVQQHEFPKALEDMIAWSVTEACEELLR